MTLVPVLVLVAVFAAAALLPVNMGLLAFVAAWGVGSLVFGEATRTLLAGFPADLFLTLVGVTYLFGVAQANGTVDAVVRGAIRLVGGRVAALPWVFFGVAALLTGVGALGPAAVAILAPVALRVARQRGLSPLVTGLLVIHGTQAGAFAPGSVYGNITAEVAQRSGLPLATGHWFVASLAMNLLLAALVWAWGGRRGRDVAAAAPAAAPPAAAVDGAGHAPAALGRDQWLTLLGLAVLAIGVLAFKANTGFLALAVVVVLAAVAPGAHRGALARVDWSTVVLICGVITYVSLLERQGTIAWLGQAVSQVGAAWLATLLLCLLAGLVSAFASSTALLGVIIPLAAPVLAGASLDGAALVAALAVSTTIVDTSPFSTNGALVVANADEAVRERLLRQLVAYSGLMVAGGCALAWLLLFALPGVGGR